MLRGGGPKFGRSEAARRGQGCRPDRIRGNLRSVGAEQEPVAVHHVRVLCMLVGGVTNVEVQTSTEYIFVQIRIAAAIVESWNTNQGNGKGESWLSWRFLIFFG